MRFNLDAISELLTLKFLLVMRKKALILAMIYLKEKSDKLIFDEYST